MATLAFIDAVVSVDGNDLSSDGTNVTLDYSAEALEKTAFGDTTKIRQGGLKDWAGTLEFNQDFAASPNPDVDLFAAVGNVAYGLNANEMQYVQPGEHGQLFRFSVSLASAGPLVRGQLAFNSQISSSGNGTALNLGLVAAGQRIYSGLHVTQFDGTSLDVVIQGDAESAMGSPAGHITFAQATGLTSEWGSKAGAIADDDWWRVNFTFVGTNVTFAVFIGII